MISCTHSCTYLDYCQTTLSLVGHASITKKTKQNKTKPNNKYVRV